MKRTRTLTHETPRLNSQGDIIYFSAPGSQEHTDPNDFPKTLGAKHLQVAMFTQNVVRVLRARGKSVYAPHKGLRVSTSLVPHPLLA